MLTYDNDAQLKLDFVAEVQRHQQADQIVQGTYSEGFGDNWRGCAIGCAIHSLSAIKGADLPTSDHSVLEDHGLWPKWLSRLVDSIFERLPVETAVKWPLRFARAIPVGADLESIKWQFCAHLMRERTWIESRRWTFRWN